MRIRYLMVLATLGCAPADTATDTTAALPAIDTLKPAADTLTPAIVMDTDSAGDTVPLSRNSQPATSTKTATKTDTSGHLGRDRAIKVNPRDPRRQLPTVDTTKPPAARR